MAERKCLMTFYPTDCKDDCFSCKCGGAEATKDMYVSINNVQRVCSITGGAADTDEGEYIAEVIRNNLENMVIPAADVKPVDRWISVNDRLPEEEGDVLVWIVDGKPDGIHHLESEYIANWEDGNFYDGDWNVINGITHWQPLPEPPNRSRRYRSVEQEG